MCHAVSGHHYDIGESDGSLSALMPLADVDTEADNLWAQEWVAICYELQTGRSPTPKQKMEVYRAMQHLKQMPKHMRSLDNFVTTVQDKEIHQALLHYTLFGAMGHLLDGQKPFKEEHKDILVCDLIFNTEVVAFSIEN
ncbi:hypothetical protein [Bartonella sp. AR 15-3]|uniref:hypothetical protein n=1 Tax=Bartonella sp. AR 15-3 TaxID=545617 RepID=UPI0001F4C7F1